MKRQGIAVQVLASLLALCLAQLARAQTSGPELLDAHTVLGEMRHAEPQGTPHKSDGAQLLADLHDFRTRAATLDSTAAVAAWFGLLNRASAGAARFAVDPASIDFDTQMPVGVLSVVAALPPPPAWSMLRAEAKKRAAQGGSDYHALAVGLLGDVLVGDRGATRSSLSAIDTALASLPPEARILPRQELKQVRGLLTRLYGTSDEVARSFVDAAAASEFDTVEVPDLVTLVGESEATRILRDALNRPVTLHVPSGDATRTLARQLALQQLDTLKLPQWGLVDSIEAAPLYEALTRRFVANASATSSEEARALAAMSNKDQADVYYLLYLIVNGRNTDAEKALESISAGDALSIPEVALEALQRAHQNQALFAFLGTVLTAHPEIRAWDVYIQQAAYVGRSRDALELLDQLLKRSDLLPYVRSDLQLRRVDALLGLGDTARALPALEALLRAPPSASDHLLQQRANAAVRLAGLSRVLAKPEFANVGFRFAQNALELPAEGSGGALDRINLLHSLFAELRKQHRESEAQRAAVTELKRADGGADAVADQMELVGIAGRRPARRAALVELVSLYAAANRPADVRTLLDEAQDWGARDLRELLPEKDSLGVPLAVSVGRALSSGGDNVTAARLATATIGQFPGNDAAYELEGAVDARALEVFASQFATDQFEKRPLIWRAVMLERAGQHAEAEKAVREAIAIDPSDGDEGVNDRMRGYAVLADILEARGDSKGATEYRAVVTAIRLSEKSDELYGLGLYQAAFAGYREALGHFADAYCIQSRLAVQLSRVGQHEQAAQHYRRAYELMPASFGRVESHCFGCESVFDGAEAQSIADEVFRTLASREPRNPRVHYLQGYLWEHEGKYAQALPAFRTAVQIDGDYLNAWRHMYQLSQHIQLDAVDRDVTTVKLLELDPLQRHVTYDVSESGDFVALWNTLEHLAGTHAAQASAGPLYRLAQSATLLEQKQSALPPALRAQIEVYQTLLGQRQSPRIPLAPVAIGRHRAILAIGTLMMQGGGETD